jgi:outer membrane protein
MRIKKLNNSVFFTFCIILMLFSEGMYAQKVGFFSSALIREKFSDYKQGEQRLNSLVDEWKREIDALQKEIDALEFEISKNRLIWSDDERIAKETELEAKKKQKQDVAKLKFETNGEYDNSVGLIMKPIEDKIFAAVQEVANDEGYDLLWDKSVQPLGYVNYKYDVTVKVLRKLGVDVDELEKELQSKIDTDPRNQKKEPVSPRKRKKSRTGGTVEEQDFEQPGEGTDKEAVKPANSPGRPDSTRPKPPQDFQRPRKKIK